MTVRCKRLRTSMRHQAGGRAVFQPLPPHQKTNSPPQKQQIFCIRFVGWQTYYVTILVRVVIDFLHSGVYFNSLMHASASHWTQKNCDPRPGQQAGKVADIIGCASTGVLVSGRECSDCAWQSAFFGPGKDNGTGQTI